MTSFDPANAWTDANGALHLRATKNQDGWSCAEVRLTRSLGYGTYLFVVRDISHLEPSAVLSLFTWDDMIGTDENRQELDIEMSRWGSRTTRMRNTWCSPITSQRISFDLICQPACSLTRSGGSLGR